MREEYTKETITYTIEYHTDAGKIFYWNNQYDRSYVRPQFGMETEPEYARKMEKWSRVLEILNELKEDGDGLLVSGRFVVMQDYSFYDVKNSIESVDPELRHLYKEYPNSYYNKTETYWVWYSEHTKSEVDMDS